MDNQTQIEKHIENESLFKSLPTIEYYYSSKYHFKFFMYL